MSLTTQEREKIARGIERHWSEIWEESGAWTSADLVDAIGNTDDWIETNQGGYNSALPQPFRGEATTDQKTLVFCAVAAARVSIAFARKLFGGVD